MVQIMSAMAQAKSYPIMNVVSLGESLFVVAPLSTAVSGYERYSSKPKAPATVRYEDI